MRAALMMTSVAVALGLGAACVDTRCGQYEFQGEPAGEWCGPNGSFGFINIDEGMAQIYLEPHRELGDYNVYYDSIPFWYLHFRDFQLTPGNTVSGEDLIGECSYFPLIGSGQGVYVFPATVAEMTVEQASSRVHTGGMSWRFSWTVECDTTAGPMISRGSDLIELGLRASGYEGSPYGVPPDRDAEAE